MDSKKYMIFLMILFIILVSGTVFASETGIQQHLTARSFAMGGAFTAQADNIEAVLYNPAALVDAGLIGLNVNVGIELNNISQFYEARNIDDYINNNQYANVIEHLPDDASVNTQGLIGLKVDSFALTYNHKVEMSSQIENNTASVDIIQSREGILSFANEIINPPLGLGALSYGVNLKFFDIDKDIYQLTNNYNKQKDISGRGFGLDLGLMAKLTDIFRVGYFLENAVSTNVDLEGEKREYIHDGDRWKFVDDNHNNDYTQEYSAETKSRIGASISIPLVNLTLAADIDDLFNQVHGQVLHMGLEKNFLFNAVSLRAGRIDSDYITYNTFGLGLNLTGFSMDTAFGFEGSSGSNLAAMISVNALF
ncbi:hypothetical protein [Natronospora cellulosivora (SeqCode)]